MSTFTVVSVSHFDQLLNPLIQNLPNNQANSLNAAKQLIPKNTNNGLQYLVIEFNENN